MVDQQNRNTDIADIIASSQKNNGEPTTDTTHYLTGPQSVGVTSTGTVVATGGPPYYCGGIAVSFPWTFPVGWGLINCGFWTCS